MATTPTSKIDAVTEQVRAEKSAEAAIAAASEAVSTKAVEKAVAKDEAKPVKVKAVKKAVAKKKAPAKRKPAAKKAAAKKAVHTKTPAKKASAKRKPSAKKTAPKAAVAAKTKISNAKDTIMTKAKTKTADYTAQLTDAFSDVQARAKNVYAKGSEVAADMGEFTKGNVEAVVESGKLLSAGVQDMGKAYVEDVKAAATVVVADAKEVAAVKSPTEFMQLQSKIARRNFDAMIAQTSKNTEAMVKLANEAFAPISSRASVAMAKIRKAA